MNKILARDNITYEGPNLVVCEGFSDAQFLKHLLDIRGIESFEIGCPTQAREGIEADGRDGIFDYLQALRVYSTRAANGLSTVAVMLDSDTDPHQAMTDAATWLTNAGFVAPERPFQWTNADEKYRTAILLMPGPSPHGEIRTGTLDHLLVDVVEIVAPNVFQCVEQFAACLGGQDGWPENRKAKMRTRAMIAGCCKKKPQSSLAYIWTHGPNIFPLNHTIFDFIANFFQQVARRNQGQAGCREESEEAEKS